MIGADLVTTERIHRTANGSLFRGLRHGKDPCLVDVADASSVAAASARFAAELGMAEDLRAAGGVAAQASVAVSGRPALVLDPSAGAPLASSPATKTLPLSSRLEIVLALARALASLHARGLVHAELCPSAVFHDPTTGQCRIRGLGSIHSRGAWAPPAPPAEESLPYLAPEVFGRAAADVDERSDLYGLGAIAYEMLTGERPFEASDALQWAHQHAAKVPAPPSAIADDVPPVVSALVMKLLEKSPDARYQSARGAVQDLARCLSRSTAFELGEDDRGRAFRVSRRLHGRTSEVDGIARAFERAHAGRASELVVVAGPSGVGKSALVYELTPAVMNAGGFFAAGKFDQYRGQISYSAFVAACEALVDPLLGSDALELHAFRERVNAALGANVAVLVELVPGLARVLGRHPPAAALDPAAAQHRLHFCVRSFLEAFNAPVLLFLDDLQWSDAATVALLGAVFVPRLASPVLLALSMRDAEVGPDHDVRGLLRAAATAGCPVSSFALEPLDRAQVGMIVADTIGASRGTSERLADMVFAKAEGNPFFVKELLHTLYLEGLLELDDARGQWVFDAARIEATEVSDDVAGLMIARLLRLPESARELLRVAAMVGTEVAIDDLAGVLGTDSKAVLTAMAPAVEEGLVRSTQSATGRAAIRFRHDRIQQAAHAATAPAARPPLHLAIARWLRATLAVTHRDARVLETAAHFDAAFDIVPADERPGLLEVFRAAADAAKGSTAYAQARDYFERAITVLGPDPWTHGFEIAFELHIELAECEYLAGLLAGATARFEELLSRARTDLERARVYYLQIRLFQVAGDFGRAAELCVTSFALFGLVAPDAASASREVEADNRAVIELIGDRPIASLVDEPPMTDPEKCMLADLLEASGPPLYMVRPELFPWVALQLVGLSLGHGNGAASCYGYGIYALLRAAIFGDVEGGLAMSHLAIAVNARFGTPKLEGCMLHLLGDHVNFWKNPIASDIPILERGFDACVRAGDPIYANYIGFQSPWHRYEAGMPLAEVAASCERYLSFAQQSRYEPVAWTIRMELAWIAQLKGEPANAYEPSRALAEVTAAKFGCGMVYFHILDVVAKYTFGDGEGALAAAERAIPELGSAFSMPIFVTFSFFHALAIAAVLPSRSETERAPLRKVLGERHAELAKWAADCPENFADKVALVAAETARVDGDFALAMRQYERSRAAAREQGFLHYEALACELAAALYDGLGVASVRDALRADAASLYETWGAPAKARQVRPVGPVRAPSGPPRESAATATRLDAMSLTKAATSISEEIVLPRLLTRLMSVVLEYAGAERGALLLVEGEGLVVAAAGEVGPHGVVALDGSARPLPETVLNYVRRTGEVVLLPDARAATAFSRDPYFRDGARRSVLCQPVVRQGRFVGMFYLENDLRSGAFDPARAETLAVLATQTAISIENARLYEASRAAVVARDEFLAIASHELRTPLTPLAMQVHRITGAIRRGKLREMPEANLARIAETCDDQIERLSHLIGSLLDVSRIRSGRLALDRRHVDLASLVRTVVERHAADAQAAGCNITFRETGRPAGAWDPMRLEQVVTNLLVNALKFGRGKPVEIEVGLGPRGARLVVSDGGPGVRPEDRPRIFDRFERVGSSTNVDGLGLGLYIARAIVEAHGGQIDVGTSAANGASFVVALPVGDE